MSASKEQSCTLRRALLSFFQTLNPNANESAAAVHAAAARVEAVAERRFDAEASRSDVSYMRFVSLLSHISVAQLRKVCEGFRVIEWKHAYHQLNTMTVKSGAGVDALHRGCSEGIVPIALSYRHSPHSLDYDPRAYPGQSGAELNGDAENVPVGCGHRCTVSKASADRAVALHAQSSSVDDGNKDTSQARPTNQADIGVVWIDRAVRGLSVDGDWFVRGLMPYCVVPIAAAHSGGADMRRPWIWLEWRFSSHALSTSELLPLVDFREVLLIALQAMFDPPGMMESYEYRDEMEAVIADIFAFGLAMMGATLQPGRSARAAVAEWSDYKVGVTVALGLNATAGDVRYGVLRVDGRDSYGHGLFPGGVRHLLASAGVEFTGPGGVTAYALVDGSVAVTKRFSEGRICVLTRVPDDVLADLQRTACGVQLNMLLDAEMVQLAKRFIFDSSCLGSPSSTADALVLLSCCDVTVNVEDAKQQHMCLEDDSKKRAKKTGVTVVFNLQKARLNASRVTRFGMKQWLRKAARGSQGNKEGIVDEVPDPDLISVGVEKRKRFLFVDVNRGVLRCILSGENHNGVIFRRFGLAIASDVRVAFVMESVLSEGSGHLLRKAVDLVLTHDDRLVTEGRQS